MLGNTSEDFKFKYILIKYILCSKNEEDTKYVLKIVVSFTFMLFI